MNKLLSGRKKVSVFRVIAIIAISILAIASCAVGVAGIYALVQIPDRHINFYLIPLFLATGILLITSLLHCVKGSGNRKLGYKQGKVPLLAHPNHIFGSLLRLWNY